jgi:hypothetical protein
MDTAPLTGSTRPGELGEYRMAREFVHREDNNQLRKREVMWSGKENICNSIHIK